VKNLRKAYSYIRFSTPACHLADRERRQLAAATDYATQHDLDLDLDATCEDLGVSAHPGMHRQDGALSRLLRGVHEGHVPAGTVLIVEDTDRLTRQPSSEAVSTLRDLMQGGIEIRVLRDRVAVREDAVGE
jgi:DNA invertase Pin-like site-specific DNA recombinase